MSKKHHRIDNIELVVTDLARTKAFYGTVFDFQFTDFGPTYTEFTDGALKGGFHAEGTPKTAGGPLLILYSDDLAATQARIVEAGGTVVKEAFAFPGGRRFHFTDPDGYELAVWTEA